MQPLDLVILLRMVADDDWSIGSLQQDFGLDDTSLQASLRRTEAARLYSPISGRPNRRACF